VENAGEIISVRQTLVIGLSADEIVIVIGQKP